MKRLLVMLAGATMLAFVAAGAAAAGSNWLTVTPNPVVQNHTVVFSGAVPAPWLGLWLLDDVKSVTVTAYGTDASCTTEASYGPFTTTLSGVHDEVFATAALTASAAPGDYYYTAQATFKFHSAVTSGCTKLSIVTAPVAQVVVPPRGPDGIFVCYNASQPNPMVVPKTAAQALLDAGYWLPIAVPGLVAGGTNLPGTPTYHLTCNVAAGQAVSNTFVGGGGDILGMPMLGVYPVTK